LVSSYKYWSHSDLIYSTYQLYSSFDMIHLLKIRLKLFMSSLSLQIKNGSDFMTNYEVSRAPFTLQPIFHIIANFAQNHCVNYRDLSSEETRLEVLKSDLQLFRCLSLCYIVPIMNHISYSITSYLINV
jgi:hypothetical protein